MPLHFDLDGRRVHLNDDFELTITSNGGYEQLTATADRDEVAHAHQGSHISAHTSVGKEVWYGTLDATPAISRHPIAQITASGPVAKARRQRGNRLYQNRDYSLWGPITSDPHNYTAIGALNVAQSVGAQANTGAFLYTISNGTDIKQNDANGLCFWGMGEAVTRVAFDWAVKTGTSSYSGQVYTGTGPNGTLTQRGADFVTGAGASGSVDYTLSAGDDDLIALVYTRTAADATTSANAWLRIGNLRVNGRTLLDDLSPAAIIQDFGGALGWKVVVPSHALSSGQNALPFYWQGGSWADAIDELAILDDWPWLVTHDALNYTPWDTKWQLRFPQEQEDLSFPPVYNFVRVFYTTLAGAPRSIVLQAKPDPLARFGENNEYQYDLSQSYDGDDIPTRVAAALLSRVSVQRVVGTVTLLRGHMTGRVWTPHKRYTTYADLTADYDILPGDMGLLEPYPNLPPQRITGVRLHAHDVQVEFGVASEASATRALARAALSHSRAHHSLTKKKKS